MKRFTTISLALLLTSCATTETDIRARKAELYKEKGQQVGEPMTTLLGETNLEDTLKRLIESSRLTGKQQRDTAILQEIFLQQADLSSQELTGHARLIFENLGSILKERLDGLPPELPEDTHKECVEAYKDKVAWHKQFGEVPAIFGKITEYVLTPVPGTEHWVGAIDLCTWIGAENYYFNISFIEKGPKSLTLKGRPFTDVIPTLTDDDDPAATLDPANVARFNYKLHANDSGKDPGEGAVIYKNVFKNSKFYPAGHIIYAELEEDCFDTFYIDKPTGIKAVDLADQLGYCMGRCDGRVLNTGRN